MPNSPPKVVREKALEEGKTIFVELGDITTSRADAIVNAANERLAHGGGVAGAISRKGGPEIQKESTEYVDAHGLVKTGTVAVTGPGKLFCKRVIHAVGPVWEDGRQDEPELLRSAVSASLRKAAELELKSISMPAISSGIFGFPKPLCAKIMFDAAEEYFREARDESVQEIRFTNFDDETVDIFSEEFDRVPPCRPCGTPDAGPQRYGNRKKAAEATAAQRKSAAEWAAENAKEEKKARGPAEADGAGGAEKP